MAYNFHHKDRNFQQKKTLVILLYVSKQYLSISAVKNIVDGGHHFAKVLKAPPLVADVKLVCVSPHVKDLRTVRLHRQKPLAKAEHFVHLDVVIDRRIEFIQIGLQVKIARAVCRAAIPHARVLTNNIGYALVVVDPSAGICKSHDLVARDLGERQAIFLYLTNYLVLVGNIGQKRVRFGMRGDLVPRVYVSHVLFVEFIMIDGYSVSHQGPLASAKSRIEIKRRLQAVFIKYLDQTRILRNAVVIAERQRLHFSAKHSPLLCEILSRSPR